jgi:hypothetical protein
MRLKRVKNNTEFQSAAQLQAGKRAMMAGELVARDLSLPVTAATRPHTTTD